MPRLQSVSYEAVKTWREAQEMAGAGYENPMLLSGCPCEQGSDGLPSVSAYPSALPEFFGHGAAALGIVAASVGDARVRVLDVGGATGLHYHAAQRAFNNTVHFEWTVLETPTYVAHGIERHAAPGLRFVPALAQGDVFDIAYLSGVLPYVQKPEALLRETTARAPFALIMRTSLGEEEILYLQRATYDEGVVSYPGRITSWPWLNGIMARLGFSLYAAWGAEHYGVDNRVYHAPAMLWRHVTPTVL